MNNDYPSDKMRIEQNEIITKKEGYEAMLYAIKAYWENSGVNFPVFKTVQN